MVRPGNLQKVEHRRQIATSGASTNLQQHVSMAWGLLGVVSSDLEQRERGAVSAGEVCARGCKLVRDWIRRRRTQSYSSATQENSTADIAPLAFIAIGDHGGNRQYAAHGQQFDIEDLGLMIARRSGRIYAHG